MNDITKVEVVDIDKLELAQRSAIVRPVDLAGTILAYEEFETVKKELLNDNDFAYFDSGGKMVDKGKGNGYIKKSGWRKIKTAFGISISLDDGRRTTGVDAEGNYYVWRYKTRATTPNGIYQDADGACSSRKAFFSKKYGKRVDPDEEDIILMAQTVAINRVISDLVGGGEVSAEEMYGRDEEKKPITTTTIKAISQTDNNYGLDPMTYKLNGGKFNGKLIIDCDSNYIEWMIGKAKESKYKQTYDKIPMDYWTSFLEACLSIHKANKEPKPIEPEYTDIESAPIDDLQNITEQFEKELG
jgi:hypothetical protein